MLTISWQYQGPDHIFADGVVIMAELLEILVMALKALHDELVENMEAGNDACLAWACWKSGLLGL